MAEITMPKLSDTMTEGVVVRWHKKKGDVDGGSHNTSLFGDG